MCVVSMIGDHYHDKFKQWPGIGTDPYQSPGGGIGPNQTIVMPSPISRQEFDDLKRDVLEMKELLKRAKEYDERNNEPDCEVEDKMEVLRQVARLVGIDLDDVIGKSAASE